MELDTKDFALLEALQQDASQRLEDLAKLVSLAPSSVHDRLRRLQRSGILQQWTVKVDAARLGLGVQAFIGLTTSTTCTAMLEQFAALPSIEECHSIAGEKCVMLKVRVPDTESLLALIERLREIDGVIRTDTTIVLATHIDRAVSLQCLPKK